MTAGEFSRKLKAAINEAGYTSNNVHILSVDCENFACSVFKVGLVDTKGDTLEIYIEED